MNNLIRPASIMGDAIALALVVLCGFVAWCKPELQAAYVVIATIFVMSFVRSLRQRISSTPERGSAAKQISQLSTTPRSIVWLVSIIVTVLCFAPAFVLVAEVTFQIPFYLFCLSIAIFAAGTASVMYFKHRLRPR